MFSYEFIPSFHLHVHDELRLTFTSALTLLNFKFHDASSGTSIHHHFKAFFISPWASFLLYLNCNHLRPQQHFSISSLRTSFHFTANDTSHRFDRIHLIQLNLATNFIPRRISFRLDYQFASHPTSLFYLSTSLNFAFYFTSHATSHSFKYHLSSNFVSLCVSITSYSVSLLFQQRHSIPIFASLHLTSNFL